MSFVLFYRNGRFVDFQWWSRSSKERWSFSPKVPWGDFLRLASWGRHHWLCRSCWKIVTKKLSYSYLSFPSTFPFFSANLPRRLDNGCPQVLPKARYQAIFFIILKHDNNDNNNRLPMMYLDDCLRSTVEFMLAPPETLSTRFFFINNEDGMKRLPSW